MVTANLSFVESKLKEEGFADEDFAYIYSKAQHFLIDELSLLIKDVFLKKLDTPIEVANWILHGKKTNDLSGFAFLSNKIDKYIENPGQGDMVESVESSMGKQINLNNYGINDLVDILGEMRIDLESWVKKWNKDDIHLNLVEGLEIEIIKKKELELSSLLDQHRMLEAANLLEESYIKSILRTYSIRRLERVLSKLGISPSELEENRTVAKRIVWVKKIAELKDSHLKRIFSSSWQDFKIFSKQIESLTKLIRKLGQGIPSEGLKWIESELETLAIQSATYKLNLLRTIQEFEYDAGRKRDIEHLSKVLLHMWNKKMARSNEYKRKRSFLKTIQLRLKVIARRFTRA